MTKIPIKPLTSWSFSRYSTYRQCPLKAKLAFIDRIKEPPNDAMARGAAIHKQAEAYIKGGKAKLGPELASFKDELKRLRAQYKKDHGMVVEDTWAFTKDWTETTWDDWVGCWLRIKLDCAHHQDETTLVVTDWKTGRFRPERNEEYVEQLELYALAALLLHPHLERVGVRLAYTDLGVMFPAEELLWFTPKDMSGLKKLWAKRVKPMMSDKTFVPKPNNFCRWCHYRASNKAAGGGQCKY